MKTIKLISCIGLDFDSQLLPHFIEHYRKLDIDSFHLILHSKNDFDIDQYKTLTNNLILDKWVGVFDGVTKTNKLNVIIRDTTESHILMADVDEFQIWDNSLKSNDGVVWGILQDRESTNKKLNEVTTENLEDQFPLETQRTKWDPKKPCLFPSTDKLLSPHHLRDNQYKDEYLIIKVNHYRWIKGRLEKSKERDKVYNELNKKGVKFESGIWGEIPNWESQDIINQYKDKTII